MGEPVVDLQKSGRYWILSRIVVPRDARGQGVGTALMQALMREADAEGAIVALTPSTDFGASSTSRLAKFYRRFGFVPNKGRHKDFAVREAMIRYPHEAKRSAPRSSR
ncbi:MAG: GNAT family N-acetyltransferase [Candidatus Cryosericum sp.]